MIGGYIVKMMKKISIISVMFVTIFVLSGCFNQQTPEEQIYDVLEKAVDLEKDFENQQDPLLDLENEEKELYNQIISLGMKEYDKIVQLSKQAIEIVDKRKDLMEKENDSILSAKKEFEKMKPILEKIEDENNKKLGEKLYDTMMDRYDAHEKLYEKYMEGLSYDRELYEMFQNKDLSMKDLQSQIEKINQTYEEVIKANQVFNDTTNQYNQDKMEFYEEANLNIEIENNEK